MKKILTILSILFLLTSVAKANFIFNESDETLLGSWVFSVNEAPWEYSKGKVVFEKDDANELTGKVIFDSGRQIPILSISVGESTLTFEVNVDGNHVTSFMALDGDIMTGHVQTADGNMNFSAQKEISEG
ncbi:MAG: hypothetical protein EA359_17525 [Balneolaceae bacterium]|nr:MAG: hypothetical protein EA359_17525 [Balneolaceae bacterium]